MNNKMTSLGFLILFATNVLADTSYTCITDKVTGFSQDTEMDDWEFTRFLPGERFLLSHGADDTYELQKLGEQTPWSAICTARHDQTEDSFSCTSRTNEFHFNRKAMRFTSFRYFGYWNGSSDSLSIAIGKCYEN